MPLSWYTVFTLNIPADISERSVKEQFDYGVLFAIQLPFIIMLYMYGKTGAYRGIH